MSVVARCAGELLLNRRLAPDIYCGLISVVANDDDELALRDGDHPGAPEHGVAMTVLDEQRTLETQLTSAGRALTALRALGERLAAFHASTDRVRPPARPDVLYQRRFDDNLAELLEALDSPLDRARARRVQATTSSCA